MGVNGAAEHAQPLPACTSASGELFLYDEEFGFPAFEFGGRGSSAKALVCVGGLTDGLLSLRYLPMLADAVSRHGWRIVQPVLSSSYRGWGIGSLDEDVAEIDKLLECLATQRGISEVGLLGHSTGCQDVVRYLAVGKHASKIQVAILQAPVSDREALSLTSSGWAGDARSALQKYSQMASAWIDEGRGAEVMPREACLLLGPPHAITAYRFNSLTGRMTDDDMFSSDLTDAELQGRLGHIAIPTLIAVSLDDEYVPATVDSAALVERMGSSMAASSLGLVQRQIIKKGGHALRSPEGKQEFVDAVAALLGRLGSLPKLTWELEVAKELKERASAMPAGRPYMVALAGMPGAGKSTAAGALARLIGPSCLVVPMDGFHLPLADLRARPDADDAIYRRGAPDTFDPATLRQRLGEISAETVASAETVHLPSFDHAVGDPVQGALTFIRGVHHIVIVEGLYLLHEDDGWKGIAHLFDRRIYIDANIDMCIAAVKERNKCIPGYTPEQIEVRCDRVDRQNALTVAATADRADVVVSSAGASPRAGPV